MLNILTIYMGRGKKSTGHGRGKDDRALRYGRSGSAREDLRAVHRPQMFVECTAFLEGMRTLGARERLHT